MNKQKKNKWFLYLKNNIFINFCFSFNILIIFSFFKEYKNQNLNLNYPISITLLNGNIFVIYEEGIKIYDSKLNNSNTILNFTENDKIDDITKYVKVAISRFSEDNYGYIISVINDKIYIFDCEGNILYKKETSLNGKYYSIVPIKEENKEFTYMICFINSNNYINYYFYKYNNNNKNEELYFNNSDNYNYKLSELSCQLMNNYTIADIIVCFVVSNDSPKTINQFFIDPNDYTFINTINTTLLKIDKLKAIKSVLSFDKENSLIF